MKNLTLFILLAIISTTSKASPYDKTSPVYHLAVAVYFEARGEGLAGKIGVANVIMNRVSSVHFPDTVNGVIWQRKQFSFTHDGISERIPASNWKTFDDCYEVAHNVFYGVWPDLTNGSDHYLRRAHSSATWYKNMQYNGELGNHSFYKR